MSPPTPHQVSTMTSQSPYYVGLINTVLNVTSFIIYFTFLYADAIDIKSFVKLFVK